MPIVTGCALERPGILRHRRQIVGPDQARPLASMSSWFQGTPHCNKVCGGRGSKLWDSQATAICSLSLTSSIRLLIRFSPPSLSTDEEGKPQPEARWALWKGEGMELKRPFQASRDT